MARKKMSKSLFLLIILLIISVIFSQLFFYQFDGHEAITLIERLIISNHIFFDFLIITGLLAFFGNGGLFRRLAGYSILILFILIYSAQYASFSITGDYLSPTAIENIQHIGLIQTTSKTTIAGLLIIFLAAIIIVAELYFKETSRKKVLLILVSCFALAALLRMDEYWLSSDILSNRAAFYHSDNNSAKYASPIEAFFKSLERTWQFRQQRGPLAEAELHQANNFGFFYNEQQTYPLIKDYIYKTELPFPIQEKQTDPDTALNIIVIFSEGISARIIQPYNNQYLNLSPNIADFARSAMRVDNYFNHTFATYRGLLGQLCSIFPIHAGGKISGKTDYYCLGNLFNEDDYETYFLFSQQKGNTKLDEVLAKTNIDHILAQEDLRHLYLADEPKMRPLALSDQQFFKAFIEHLRGLESEQKAGNERAFFVGLYNIETHAYYHMSEDGVTYKEQDSYVLDTIHNFDNAFGKFWQYFKQSGLFENTIVVLTSDHAHFQGTDFVSLIKQQSDYKPYFVDRIPLLIYHPSMELPTDFDAKHASSLDFAPTIAHLMKLENRSNSFLGRSIFERVTNEGLAYGEGYIYLIGPEDIKQQGEYLVSPPNDTSINQMYKVINNIQALESQGRIWDRTLEE